MATREIYLLLCYGEGHKMPEMAKYAHIQQEITIDELAAALCWYYTKGRACQHCDLQCILHDEAPLPDHLHREHGKSEAPPQ